MNNKYFPKISIVTPNFNGEKYLEETILSVISQDYPNLEYIIIDGGSTDTSVQIIKKYESQLSFWMSEKDKGMYHAIQKGFEKSTGDIMAWINSDDMYHVKSLFSIAEIFTSFNQVNWLTGHNTNFDEKGRIVSGRTSYQHNKYTMFLNPSEHIQQESTFWRRSLWEKAGKTLDLTLKYAGDFELWMRFFKFEKLYITDALIGGFRFRKDQITQLNTRQYNDECKMVLEKAKQRLSFYDKANLKDIMRVENLLKMSHLSLKRDNILEKKLNELMKNVKQIQFDNRKQIYTLEGDTLDPKTLFRVMNSKREHLEDFLQMLKNKHAYYPEVILDVGVAEGTPSLYEAYPSSHFVLFEALEEYLPDLLKIQDSLEKVDIELCAVGAKESEIEFNVHPDLMGSSLYTEEEESNVNGYKRLVNVKTLDSFSEKYNLKNRSILLKIDVQGAEVDVLKGTKALLSNTDIVILEVSLFNFFNNGLEFYDVVSYMNKQGFVVYDIFGFLNRPLDASLAQVDLAFVKKDSSFRSQQYFATKEQRELLNNYNNRLESVSKVDNNENFNFSQQFNKFYDYINELEKGDVKYLVYGAGTVGRTVHKLMRENVVALIDQSSDIMSKDISPDTVYAVENIKNMNFDKIIITVLGREEGISTMLLNQYNISVNKLVLLEL